MNRKCCPFLCKKVLTVYFLGKDGGKTHFETKGSCKTTLNIKTAQMKYEIIRKINKKASATSTSKVTHMGIKQKSALTSVGTVSKWLKDDEDDKHNADITIHSKKISSTRTS